MGSFISRTVLVNDINGPTIISVPATQTWTSEPMNLTSEDSIWGTFLTLQYAALANATVTVEGGTEGSPNGFWADLNAFGGTWIMDGLTLSSAATKAVMSVFPAVGQSLPPFIRIKITAGAGGKIDITKLMHSRRNLA